MDRNRCLSAVSVGDSAIVLKSVMEEIFAGEDGFSIGSSLVIGCFVTWQSYIDSASQFRGDRNRLCL